MIVLCTIPAFEEIEPEMEKIQINSLVQIILNIIKLLLV